MKKTFFLIPIAAILLGGCNNKSPHKKKDVSLVSISVSDYQKEFKVGDVFSVGSLKISASYSDESTRSIAVSDAKIDSSKYDKNTAGTYLIDVSYTEKEVTKSTSYSVVVKKDEPGPRVLTGLEVKDYPSVFVVGEEFTYGNITITGNYSDSTTENIDPEKATFSGYSSTVGPKTITVTYQGVSTSYQVIVNSDVVDLGKKTIAEVREYAAAHPITVPEGKIGAVDQKTRVTIEGFLLLKNDLVKTTKKYGCDVSQPGKVLMGDSTGYMFVASDKLKNYIEDNDGKDTSKYRITGFLSQYLGHVELLVETYKWDKTISCSFNAFNVSKGIKTVSEFYNIAAVEQYNCAGHGYGDIYTIKNVEIIQYEAKGTGKQIYYVTDGNSMMKVITRNRGYLSQGHKYNIAGVISLQNYSAAMYLLNSENSTAEHEDFDPSKAETLSIDNLRKICYEQDDTDKRFESYTLAWQKLYKTTGYITSCVENGMFYIGIRDTYYSGTTYISGKGEAQTTYKMALIDNNNFWDVKEQDLHYCPYYDYLDVNEPVEVYYFMQQQNYVKNEPAWKIFLVPASLPVAA